MSPQYTEKHCEDVSDILRVRYRHYLSYEPRLALESTIQALADLFAADNPTFDRDRFLSACGLDTEEVNQS